MLFFEFLYFPVEKCPAPSIWFFSRTEIESPFSALIGQSTFLRLLVIFEKKSIFLSIFIEYEKNSTVTVFENKSINFWVKFRDFFEKGFYKTFRWETLKSKLEHAVFCQQPGFSNFSLLPYLVQQVSFLIKKSLI